jgi:hypothetical protein
MIRSDRSSQGEGYIMYEPQAPLAIDWTAQRALLGRHYCVWQLNLYD